MGVDEKHNSGKPFPGEALFSVGLPPPKASKVVSARLGAPQCFLNSITAYLVETTYLENNAKHV